MQGLQRLPQADDGADDLPDDLGDRDVTDSQPHPNTKLILVPTIPHICHEPHEYIRVSFFLAGVNFFRFHAKIWQFTVHFAVITQKIGNFLCILS